MAHLGTKYLTLTIDGEPREAEVSVAEITNAETESDFLTFAEAAGTSGSGGRDWALHIVAVQDPGDPDSLLNLTWDMTGTEVDVLVKPYGNEIATASQPHYEGTVVVSYPDGVIIGGEADASNSARFTFEVEWAFTAKPEKIVA